MGRAGAEADMSDAQSSERAVPAHVRWLKRGGGGEAYQRRNTTGHARRSEIRLENHSTATIVLVHGACVDGSGWQAVYKLLNTNGHRVRVVQNPTLTLRGDVAATKLVIDGQSRPVVLVGHSYGGAVITEAGTDANVSALVYIAAFAPDKDESVNTLIAKAPDPVPPLLPPRD